MGIWRGETFKEYIQEELYCFVEGIFTAMKHDFQFVKIDGGSYSKLVDVTRNTVISNYYPGAHAS